MVAATKTEKRDNGFSVYPDAETLSAIDKFATSEDRKRSPATLVLIKKGLEAVRKAAK